MDSAFVIPLGFLFLIGWIASRGGIIGKIAMGFGKGLMYTFCGLLALSFAVAIFAAIYLIIKDVFA